MTVLSIDDPRVSVRAPGPLEPFVLAGVLTTPDVQTATALHRICVDYAKAARSPHADREVTLAAALAVRALRAGSIGLNLTTVAESTVTAEEEVVDTSALPWPDAGTWLASCRDHPMVAVGDDAPADRPLRLGDDGLLYLQKYWQQQELIAADIARRATFEQTGVDHDDLAERLQRLFPDADAERPRLASAVAATGRLLILAGGPGTGKTTTIARILALLRELCGPQLQTALAAPTGKAAARMAEATNAAIDQLYADSPDRRFHVTAQTMHRLLGWRGASTRYAHDRRHPLPHDVVVIDETSMVAVTMMARLLEAVRPEATVILVGDPDQLAAIEAGAVLADIVRVATPPPGERADRLRAAARVADADAGPAGTGRITLTHNFRFGGGIADLAEAIRAGDGPATVEVLRGRAEITFVEIEPGTLPEHAAAITALRAEVVGTARDLTQAAQAGDDIEALRVLDRHRLLCAHRAGPYGVARWNALARSWIDKELGLPPAPDGWPIGRPLLVTRNDRALGLANGDTGVIIADADGSAVAVFDGGDAPLRIPPIRLDNVVGLESMTIHKGQGSQFAAVTVVLPPPESPLLTRELLYTAVTRAQERVRIIGTASAVELAVGRHVRRASGLQRSIERRLAST